MQNTLKLSFDRVPELTKRDAGELATNKPPLPQSPLTWELKRLWSLGYRQGQIAKMTGQKIDYVKKHTACFSRALRTSPTDE